MKIVIVDDHPLVRRGLSAVLALDSEIELAGEAETVEEALKLVADTGPDLAIVDLKLGSQSGLELVGMLRSASTRTIVLTSSHAEADLRRAEESGASGYVLKEALPEELLLAIKIVARGKKYFDPGLMDMIHSQDKGELDKLTPKEREVLLALGEGLSNQGMAKKLVVTEFTVKKHVSQILSKLHLNDRTQAALYAQSKGLVTFAYDRVSEETLARKITC